MKRHFLILSSLFCILLCPKAQSQTLHLMAYNIHHGCDTSENLQLANLAKLILKSKAQILALEEVDSVCNRSGKTDEAQVLARLTHMHFAYVRHFAFDGGSYGLALLSAYPISDVVNNRLPVSTKENGDTRAFLTATIHLPGGKQVLAGVVHLDYRDEASRVSQSRIIAGMFKDPPEPVLLMGDLNDGPASETIRQLEQLFSDANPRAYATYPAANPKEKIDFIFVSKAHYVTTIDEPQYKVFFSDHLPVSSIVKLR